MFDPARLPKEGVAFTHPTLLSSPESVGTRGGVSVPAWSWPSCRGCCGWGAPSIWRRSVAGSAV